MHNGSYNCRNDDGDCGPGCAKFGAYSFVAANAPKYREFRCGHSQPRDQTPAEHAPAEQKTAGQRNSAKRQIPVAITPKTRSLNHALEFLRLRAAREYQARLTTGPTHAQHLPPP